MRKILKAPLTALTIIGLSSLSVHAGGDSHEHKSHQRKHAAEKQVMVHAKVNRIDADKRTINVTHGAIKELNWPAMTMDMKVANDVDLDILETGQEVMVSLGRGEDSIYMITKVMVHGH
ncbi:copper-binding protein [Kordiimonas lipolytica]|uniref:Copper-binding protein n=1 Tax=Kordiimonas lipolytica TaxID=1662421 RepID=A0ABV8U6K0_9PROT|nr:copper-binding protein [Kordiimonas lipolytica]